MSSQSLWQAYSGLPPGLQVVLALYGFMLFIRLVDWIIFRDGMTGRFGLWGVRAKHGSHFLAWFLNPFIHVNWRHLWGNSLPWLIMAAIIALPSLQEYVLATTIIILVGDVGVWLFEARNGATAGASGMVTGYFGHILLRGFFMRDASQAVIALVVFAFYYSILRLVFIPQKGTVSNVGHFFGFAGGVLAAWIWAFILRQPFQ